MMDWKEMLGEDLATKMADALKGKGKDGKDVELVIGNDGSSIPKDKYDKALADKKAAEELAAGHQKALDEVKAAGDPEQLKNDLEEAQKATKEAAETYQKQLAEKDLDFAVRQAIADAHDAGIVSSLLDREKLKLTADGTVVGLDEQLKGLRQSKSFLFAQKTELESAPTITGISPADGKPSTGTDAALATQMEQAIRGY